MPAPSACRRRTSAGLDLTLVSAALPRTCHGVLEVPEPSSAWTPDPGSEQCLYTARVAFSEPFLMAPHVVAGLSALELGTAPGPAARLEVRIVPGTVSRSGFTIRFATRAGACVESAAAFWLAMSV